MWRLRGKEGDGIMTLEDRKTEEGRMFEMRKRKGVCQSEGHREDGSLST